MVRSSFKTTCSYLRKHRKWPHSPYKAKWHQNFDQIQAMETLKQASSMPPPAQLQHHQQKSPYLLTTFLHSYNVYDCDPTPQAYHFVLKTLAQSSQFHHIPSVLDHLERVEKFETPEYVFTALIKIYGQMNKIHDAVDLFYRIPKFRCVPTVYSLNSLLSVLCRSREGLKSIPEILLKTQVLKIRVEESSFRILITALCRLKKVCYAIEILYYTINDGCGVDSRMCSLIMSSLCEQKDLSSVKVLGFLEEMRKLGFRPGGMDYANVIKFLVKEKRGMDALNVLNQMKFEGIKPDIVCYTMVLSGVIAEGDYAKADELFDELLVLGLVPDIYTYNVYIHGLCKQEKVEEGIEILPCMDELHCRPNVITYNTLLEALCKVGELSRARELVREMGMKGVGLNAQSYRIMLDGMVGEGEIIKACGLLEEMLDKCFCDLQCSTTDEIICGLCQKDLVCKALQLLKNMVHQNVAPGARAWEALLLSCESKINFSEATLFSLVKPCKINLTGGQSATLI